MNVIQACSIRGTADTLARIDSAWESTRILSNGQETNSDRFFTHQCISTPKFVTRSSNPGKSRKSCNC